MPVTKPNYVAPFLNRLNPQEEHNAGGDCINPKCDYVFTDEDKKNIQLDWGYFQCPKCGQQYNYYDAEEAKQDGGPGGWTRAGLSMDLMGSIGESVVERLVTIPTLGQIVWVSQDKHSPLDMIAGTSGIEIKTNHSEAQPRFKLGGQMERAMKYQECKKQGVTPALIGVRLNFYRDVADIFVRPDGMIDTWIGNPRMPHVAKVDFTDLNPYKHPHEVPPPNMLPQDDSTPAQDGIPF
jgi:hypothetical protein